MLLVGVAWWVELTRTLTASKAMALVTFVSHQAGSFFRLKAIYSLRTSRDTARSTRKSEVGFVALQVDTMVGISNGLSVHVDEFFSPD